MFQGFMYSGSNTTNGARDLLYAHRRAGDGAPSAVEWGDVEQGSPWNSSSCARGITCTAAQPGLYLAGACPDVATACGGPSCAGTCVDREVRVQFGTDGIYQTNLEPPFFAQQSICATLPGGCVVTVDAALDSALACQAWCQKTTNCAFFSHEVESNYNRSFHL